MQPVLELRGVTKCFGDFMANDNVSLTLNKGEVHSLLGENGAGKSTLMNVLYGLYRPTAGSIVLEGREIPVRSPKQMLGEGIAMVHQHFMLVPTLTVAENVVLGSMRPFRPRIAEVAKKITELAASLGFEVDPYARISTLTVGTRQRVEIIKSLYRNIKVLILDEPTAVLTPQETDELLVMLRRLAQSGISILFISHKFDEVLSVSDRISVMRRGKLVDTLEKADFDQKQLAQMMTGREVVFSVERASYTGEEGVRLRVEDLGIPSKNEKQSVKNMSFTVSRGEVLAIAGVDGNGQNELLQALAGSRAAASGHIFIGDEDVAGQPPKKLLAHGVGYIPADRHEDGLLLDMNLEENVILECYQDAPFSRRGILNTKYIEQFTGGVLRDFDVRAEGTKQAAANLSGGNQQKVVVARAMVKEPEVLLAAYPTRGLDVGAIESIHNMINAQRARGCAVVLFSNELDEVFTLGDKIGVMYEGRMMGIYPAAELDRELVGMMMAGKPI